MWKKMIFSAVFTSIFLYASALSAQTVGTADSISLNFAPHYGAPVADSFYGFDGVRVDGKYWNNITDAAGRTQYSSHNAVDNGESGNWYYNSNRNYTEPNVLQVQNNYGNPYSLGGLWSATNVYTCRTSRPSTTDNAILYHGYLDDGVLDDQHPATIKMDVPYFQYDLYYYPSVDNDTSRFRSVNVNGSFYTSQDGATTVVGDSSDFWGNASTVRKSNDVVIEEGVNMLRISGLTAPRLEITGQNKIDGPPALRGSVAALQVVNTAASYSAWISADETLGALTWKNDLTGDTGSWSNDFSLVRLISDAGSHTITAGGEKMDSLMIVNGVNSDATSAGTTTLGGGTLNVGTLSKVGGDFTLGGGTLAADRIQFSLKQTGGTLAPGGVGEIGKTEIFGDYTITGGGITLDVLTASIYDSISATGKISADSATEIYLNLLNGFSLNEGDELVLFTGGETENLGNFSLAQALEDYWRLEIQGNSLIATLYNSPLGNGGENGVPEPATWALMLLGAAAVVCLRRR